MNRCWLASAGSCPGAVPVSAGWQEGVAEVGRGQRLAQEVDQAGEGVGYAMAV